MTFLSFCNHFGGHFFETSVLVSFLKCEAKPVFFFSKSVVEISVRLQTFLHSLYMRFTIHLLIWKWCNRRQTIKS